MWRQTGDRSSALGLSVRGSLLRDGGPGIGRSTVCEPSAVSCIIADVKALQVLALRMFVSMSAFLSARCRRNSVTTVTTIAKATRTEVSCLDFPFGNAFHIEGP